MAEHTLSPPESNTLVKRSLHSAVISGFVLPINVVRRVSSQRTQTLTRREIPG